MHKNKQTYQLERIFDHDYSVRILEFLGVNDIHRLRTSSYSIYQNISKKFSFESQNEIVIEKRVLQESQPQSHLPKKVEYVLTAGQYKILYDRVEIHHQTYSYGTAYQDLNRHIFRTDGLAIDSEFVHSSQVLNFYIFNTQQPNSVRVFLGNGYTVFLENNPDGHHLFLHGKGKVSQLNDHVSHPVEYATYGEWHFYFKELEKDKIKIDIPEGVYIDNIESDIICGDNRLTLLTRDKKTGKQRVFFRGSDIPFETLGRINGWEEINPRPKALFPSKIVRGESSLYKSSQPFSRLLTENLHALDKNERLVSVANEFLQDHHWLPLFKDQSFDLSKHPTVLESFVKRLLMGAKIFNKMKEEGSEPTADSTNVLNNSDIKNHLQLNALSVLQCLIKENGAEKDAILNKMQALDISAKSLHAYPALFRYVMNEENLNPLFEGLKTKWNEFFSNASLIEKLKMYFSISINNEKSFRSLWVTQSQKDSYIQAWAIHYVLPVLYDAFRCLKFPIHYVSKILSNVQLNEKDLCQSIVSKLPMNITDLNEFLSKELLRESIASKNNPHRLKFMQKFSKAWFDQAEMEKYPHAEAFFKTHKEELLRIYFNQYIEDKNSMCIKNIERFESELNKLDLGTVKTTNAMLVCRLNLYQLWKYSKIVKSQSNDKIDQVTDNIDDFMSAGVFFCRNGQERRTAEWLNLKLKIFNRMAARKHTRGWSLTYLNNVVYTLISFILSWYLQSIILDNLFQLIFINVTLSSQIYRVLFFLNLYTNIMGDLPTPVESNMREVLLSVCMLMPNMIVDCLNEAWKYNVLAYSFVASGCLAIYGMSVLPVVLTGIMGMALLKCLYDETFFDLKINILNEVPLPLNSSILKHTSKMMSQVSSMMPSFENVFKKIV